VDVGGFDDDQINLVGHRVGAAILADVIDVGT